MYSRIIAAIAIAVFLAGLYWRGYTSGEKRVHLEWDADKAQQTAAALKASEDARRREQELTRTVETVRGQYAQQIKNVHVVAGAAANGMRELQAALAGPAAAASATATARADDASRARVVVGACAKTVQGMAALLDEREQQLVALQGYVKSIAAK